MNKLLFSSMNITISHQTLVISEGKFTCYSSPERLGCNKTEQIHNYWNVVCHNNTYNIKHIIHKRSTVCKAFLNIFGIFKYTVLMK